MMHLSRGNRTSMPYLRWEISCTPKTQACIPCTTVQMVTAELRYECVTRSFLIDDCRITEFFRGYIVNFGKHVRSTSSDMMLVEKEGVRSSNLEGSIFERVANSHLVAILNPADYPLRLSVGGTEMFAEAGLHSSCAEKLLAICLVNSGISHLLHILVSSSVRKSTRTLRREAPHYQKIGPYHLRRRKEMQQCDGHIHIRRHQRELIACIRYCHTHPESGVHYTDTSFSRRL
ncbi:hypothetical protein TNCV_1501441 [Trichonephila clavipes]|uniref:Uncharacterized protein n=1 Tax=Trichonephila clavipes TaxID=2585209 RepID=A0A8X6UZA9_TRICX|nr:hypothetical protein TNCV_1501441 [Trichonephila clavipes]